VTIVIVIVIVVVVLAGVVWLAARRRQHDGVDSFRRQIDALSPEARRPVVDQIHNAQTDDEDHPDGT
jgi:hypothetical protein